MQQMHSPGSSPGPGYSPLATPTTNNGAKSFFGSLKKAVMRAESPASTIDGSEGGTPGGTRIKFPSFTSGQRKRETIKKLEDDTSMLHMQVGELQQHLQQEEAARVDAQERLNMQYFKANLVADMLVMRLLDLEQGMQPGRTQQRQQQPAAGGVLAGVGLTKAPMVMEESSF